MQLLTEPGTVNYTSLASYETRPPGITGRQFAARRGDIIHSLTLTGLVIHDFGEPSYFPPSDRAITDTLRHLADTPDLAAAEAMTSSLPAREFRVDRHDHNCVILATFACHSDDWITTPDDDHIRTLIQTLTAARPL